MERHPSLKQEKRSEKSRKQPVKVVYISNPMKIKASPSEFRAVVQQLTGRYATSPPAGRSIIVNKDYNHHHHQEEEEEEDEGSCGTGTGTGTGGLHDVHQDHQKWQLRSSDVSGCQVMDDFIITPQMLDGFSPLLPSDHFGS